MFPVSSPWNKAGGRGQLNLSLEALNGLAEFLEGRLCPALGGTGGGGTLGRKESGSEPTAELAEKSWDVNETLEPERWLVGVDPGPQLPWDQGRQPSSL